MTGQAETSPRYVFVAGLHRSGTTLLADLLTRHSGAAGLQDTGREQNEGQHVQSVVPPASAHGGPGRFALDPRSSLVESDATDPAALRARFERDWAPYWDDPTAPVRVEKSPPTLVRMRYFDAVFPGSRFVVIVRHPLAVTMATEKWVRGARRRVVDNWRVAHERMVDDASRLTNVRWVNYEALVAAPDELLVQLSDWLELPGEPAPSSAETVRSGVNDTYARMWADRSRWRDGLTMGRSLRATAPVARQLGYSLDDFDALGPPEGVMAALKLG